MTIVEDVVAVLAASTPAGLRTLVEQTPRLLGDEVGDALWLVAGNARADGDPELADHAVVGAALLRRCQPVGTAEAFAEAEERTPEKSRRPRTQNPRRPEAADTSLVDDLHRRCKRVIMSSLFEHAGGYEARHRLEQTFYDSVLTDPLLQPLFGAGQPQHVDHLTAFTAESFGGPDRFTRELGFAHLIAVHRGL